MAFKSSRHDEVGAAVAYPKEDCMQFNIEGLREVSPGLFELSGVKHLQLNLDALLLMLKEQGIEERAAYGYIDEFAELVNMGEITRLLARRMKRVG